MKLPLNTKSIISTLIVAWICWVSHTLEQLQKDVAKLSVSVCSLARLQGADCPTEVAELAPAPDSSFGIEPQLASPAFSFPETKKEKSNEEPHP